MALKWLLPTHDEHLWRFWARWELRHFTLQLHLSALQCDKRGFWEQAQFTVSSAPATYYMTLAKFMQLMYGKGWVLSLDGPSFLGHPWVKKTNSMGNVKCGASWKPIEGAPPIQGQESEATSCGEVDWGPEGQVSWSGEGDLRWASQTGAVNCTKDRR